MLNEIGVSLGVEYRVEVLDRTTRELKHSTDWGHNLIMNNTGVLFSKGFTEAPTVLLGSDGRVVATNQGGPISPLPAMRAITTNHDPAATQWVQPADNQATVTWSYDYEFINLGNETVILREIGIEGFSRALLKQSDGANANVPVTQYDLVVVGMRYNLRMNMAVNTVNIVDLADAVIDTFDVSYKLTKLTDISTAVWWKLFAPKNTITMVSSTGDITLSDFELETTTTSRGVNYKYVLLADDEYQWTGVKYSFQCNVPIVEAIFSKPITVPVTQKFELNINPKW